MVYSVIFHGYEQTTNDMDIWLAPTNVHRDRLNNALRKYGIDEEALTELSKRDFQEVQFFYFGNEPRRVEFLTKISNISFPETDRQKVFADIEGLQFPFLHLHHLVLAKMNTGRLKAQADVEELQKIQQAKKE